MGKSYAEDALRTIFKRCVQCPNRQPTCPTCTDGKICSLVPETCQKCAFMECIVDPARRPTTSHGPNIGAIAGGVVGGIAVISIVVFCVWRFYIKKRRAQQDQELEEEWESDDIAYQKRSQHFSTINPDGASTRTRGSLANSILSRASNIIQIAYIPGVTNRNGESGRNSVHAPVPPIPAAHRQSSLPPKSPLANEGDALFFGIGDLRDSTYSASSSIRSGKDRNTQYTAGNRDTQYTMKSISPSLMRDSVASGDSVFWDSAATQPMPATAVAKVAPRMVSVKSSNSSGSLSTDARSLGSTPTPPASSEHGPRLMIPGQGLSPSPSVTGRAKTVTVGKGRFPVSRQTSDASTLTAGTTKHAPAISSPLAELKRSSKSPESETPPSIVSLSPPTLPAQPPESPFFDASELPPPGSGASSPGKPNPYASMAATVGTSMDGVPKRGGRGGGGLSAVIEGSERGSLRAPSLVEDKSGAEDSPFEDVHEVVEEEEEREDRKA